MATQGNVVLCLAYIVGLLVWGLFPAGPGLAPAPWNLAIHGIWLPAIAGLLLLAGLILAVTVGRWWRSGPLPRVWLLAGLVAAVATLHLTWRTPAPEPMDMSRWLDRVAAIGGEQVVVEGKIVTAAPQVTRRLRGRFFLQVEQLTVLDQAGEPTFRTPVQGRVYVTAPLLQITGLHEGQILRVTGHLYRPQGALNPNSFDFQQFLAQRGTFSGLAATRVMALAPPPPWDLGRLRQRIVRSHVRGLGSPWGQLVSAMTLGRRAVDLPFDIQDLFAQVGLAHTVAASGFHVSLLLGTVLAVTTRGALSLRVTLGRLVLVVYVLLVGIQASVVRAAIMGVLALDALARDRRLNPLGALLTAITAMVIVDPTWIWDIGFQLSVMATLGLIVTVPPLMGGLPWLPIPIATAIAVPTAATLWVFPLLLFHFNTLSLISIFLNAVTLPLVMVLSLGGMATGAIALLTPTVASILAHPLLYPAQWLLWLAKASTHIPGSTLTLGQITLGQLILLYGLMGWVGWYRPAQRRWGWVAMAMTVLTLGPLGSTHLLGSRITLLAAGGDLAWVQQHQGQTTLLTTGRDQTMAYTLLPFLRQAGVNGITAAIAPALTTPTPDRAWMPLLRTLPIQHLYAPAPASPWPDQSAHYHPVAVGHSTPITGLQFQLIGTENPIFRLDTPAQSWLFLPPLPLATQGFLAQGAAAALASDVLVWPGQEVSDALLTAIHPQVALCYGRSLSETVATHLQEQGIAVYWTEREGAIAWTPRGSFQGYRQDSPWKTPRSRPWE